MHHERANNSFLFCSRRPLNLDQTSACDPPINRLPPEILTNILEFREQDRDLVAATHVCHYWRSALISAPCLWTGVQCYDVDRTSTYLERSKSAPIDILAAKTRSVLPSDSALELVVPHLGRVRLMRIVPFSSGETLLAIFSFRSPAPLLQHLEISGFPRGHISQLPRDFLGCHTPSLRTLIWDDLSLLPAFPPRLNPTYPPLDGADYPPTPLCAVLGLLSSAPRLQHLSISILDGSEATDSTPVHDIHLGSLRRLRSVSGVALSRIIPHFKAPQLKELSVILPSGVGVPTIADLLPSDSYPLITEATTVDFYAGPGDSGIKLRGNGIKVTVNTFSPHVEATNNFFSNMSSFSFARVTNLMLRMMARPLATRIGEFTNLESLDLIRCEEDADVFSALSASPQSGFRILCPRLVRMKISFYNPDAHAVDSFRQMVRSRKEAGNPLVNVNLISDRVDEILDIDELNQWLARTTIHK